MLFRNRSWLPVPFLLVALLVPAHPTMRDWIVAAALIAIGESIRLGGVAAAGSVTRCVGPTTGGAGAATPRL